jgi:CelD/BcsL family acetyltransferase involved in cellulose biosynthesis
MATPETIHDDVRTFARLHAARWRGSDRSRLVALGDRLPLLLDEIAAGTGVGDRFRLWMLELDGAPICAYFTLAAGGCIIGVNGGWDERYRRLSAPRLAFLRAVEDGYARGEQVLDLGWGRLDHKQFHANGYSTVTWSVLLPTGPQLPRGLARVFPAVATRRARETAKRAIPPERLDRARELRERALAQLSELNGRR